MPDSKVLKPIKIKDIRFKSVFLRGKIQCPQGRAGSLAARYNENKDRPDLVFFFIVEF